MIELKTFIGLLTISQVSSNCYDPGKPPPMIWNDYTAYRQFMGGSISYTAVDVRGKWMMNLDVLTGWRLGMGPCGKTCSKASVGSLTKQTRSQMESEMGDWTYFGTWVSEIKHPDQVNSQNSLTNVVRTGLHETVLSVSETDQWEQDLMKISIPVETNITYEDIDFDGCSWVNLTKQGINIPWHLQTKIDPVQARNDTKKLNACPQVLYKPLYRIKLNEETILKIAAVDPDGDYVKCGKSLYVEAGSYEMSWHSLTGVTIEDDCSVKINASTSLGYRDQDTAAVLLSVRDFNKRPIYTGNDTQNVINSGMFSLSSISVQFIVEVHANLEGPEFVSPTKEDSHIFYLYADTIWVTDVYCKMHGHGSLNFSVIARGGERVIQSNVMSDTKRHGVKYVSLSWEPSTSDIGYHIICVRAVDNNGTESANDKCFIIHVTDKKIRGISHASDRLPYFFNVPQHKDALCIINVTCVIPLHIMTEGSARITNISITQSTVAEAHVNVLKKKGPNEFKSDLFFESPKSGLGTICMMAEDSERKQSNETCIEVYVQPTDPCAALPCQNSGLCERKTDNENDYTCICGSRSNWFEKNCDQQNHTVCLNNPCIRGVCDPLASSVDRAICHCPAGYSGTDCGTEILTNCTTDPCEGRGVCQNDGPNSYTCDCFQRFEGVNCSSDLCSGQDVGKLLCPSAFGCSASTCNGHGVCSDGGVCVCNYGFEGERCQTASGGLQSSKILFAPPTPNESSSLICYFYTRDPCIIPLFLTTPHSSTSVVTVSKQSDDIVNFTSVSSLRAAPLSRFHHLYTANVTLSKGQGWHAIASGKRLLCLMAFESLSNTTDQRCFEVVFIYNSHFVAHSQVFNNRRALVKFEQPTLLGESRLTCKRNIRCYLIFYTTLKRPCKEMYTTSQAVTIFPPTATHTSCITEASFLSNKTGDHRFCFVSASKDGQTRCYIMSISATNSTSNTTKFTSRNTTKTLGKPTTYPSIAPTMSTTTKPYASTTMLDTSTSPNHNTSMNSTISVKLNYSSTMSKTSISPNRNMSSTPSNLWTSTKHYASTTVSNIPTSINPKASTTTPNTSSSVKLKTSTPTVTIAPYPYATSINTSTTTLSQTTNSPFHSNGRVAFSASMEGNMYIPARPATLKFGTVLTNIKNGYNPATGYFSAPVSGVYFIGGSITSPLNGWIKAEIVDQGQLVIVKLFAASSSNGQNQSSDFALVSLNVGDVIWVRVIDFSNSIDVRNIRSTFSGYLIG